MSLLAGHKSSDILQNVTNCEDVRFISFSHHFNATVFKYCAFRMVIKILPDFLKADSHLSFAFAFQEHVKFLIYYMQMQTLGTNTATYCHRLYS